MTMITTQLVIIQPTPFCNINCRYCYLPQRLSTKKISLETLSKIAERLFASRFVSQEITIVWHAGEPLVLPVSFYEKAYEIFQKYNTNNVRVVFSFQTNGTLVNTEWCEFFKRYGVRVGVSLDGPRHLHDAHRVDRAGKGTFDRTLRGLKLLQEAGLHPFVLAVVTESALDYPEDLWQFFIDNEVDLVGFNPEEVEGSNTYSTLHSNDAVAAYKSFVKRILVAASQNSKSPRLRELEGMLQLIRTNCDIQYPQENTPMVIINIDCDGNVSTFSPELLTARYQPYGSFVFGNVHEHSLEEILQSEKFIAVNTAIRQGIEQCRESCNYFMVCGGGAPSNKIAENGSFSSTETQACRLRIKATASAILEHLEQQHGLVDRG